MPKDQIAPRCSLVHYQRSSSPHQSERAPDPPAYHTLETGRETAEGVVGGTAVPDAKRVGGRTAVPDGEGLQLTSRQEQAVRHSSMVKVAVVVGP